MIANKSNHVTVCPVCKETNTVLIRKYRYHQPIFSHCSIVSCSNCAMVFADPMPEEDSLHKYNAGYFANAHGGVNKNNLTVAFLSAISLLRVIHVEKFCQRGKYTIKNVLEIGPGGGLFAKHWLARHKNTAKYIGVESDTVCYSDLEANGVEVYKQTSDLPSNLGFDLVVVSHVLEHTSQPVDFIKECTKQLLPGGILFIEVPCKDYQHKNLDEPHLLFFDKEPMKLLLTNLNFGNIQTTYHGNTITDLKKPISLYKKLYTKARNFLMAKRILFLFSSVETGLEAVTNPLERACIKPYKAHIEQSQPSWWLRTIAIKNK